MTEVEYRSRLDQALEEEHKDFFTASDIASRLDGVSSRGATVLLKEKSKSEEDVQNLGGSPNIYSQLNETNIPPEFFKDHRDNYHKATRVVNEIGKVSETEISDLLDNYVESGKRSSRMRNIGKIADNLKKHPQISYDEEEERYSWNG